MSQNEIHVAVIGTGVSGLRTAYLLTQNLNQKVKSISLFERNSSIGGVLNNTKKGGYLLEHGAQGVLLSRESFRNCINDLNIEQKMIIPPKKSSKRYLLTPTGLVAITPNLFRLKQKGLLRIRDILRIFFEIFLKKPFPQNPNETLYSFFFRHFGKRFTNIFLVSLSFGIWGGASRKLLVRFTFPQLIKIENGYGSLIKAAFYNFVKSLFSRKIKKQTGLANFSEGMQCLTDSLFEKIKSNCIKNKIELYLKTSSCITEIKKNKTKVKLSYSHSHSNELLIQNYDCVIYSGQPWRDKALQIESNCDEGEKALHTLRKIESHSIAVVGLGGKILKDKDIAQGFGALAGEWSQDILGVLFIHSTYPEHTPQDSFLYRVMLGGDRDPKINLMSNEKIVELAKKRLVELKIVNKENTFNFEEVIKWDNYIPLATDFQDKVIQSIWQLEALIPGLFFAGNYIKGVSISDCLDQANETASKALEHIKSL